MNWRRRWLLGSRRLASEASVDALEAFLRVGQAGLQQGVNPKPQWGDPGKVRFARSPSAMQVRPLQRAALPSEPRPLRAPRQGTAAREPPRTLRAVGPGRHATAHAPGRSPLHGLDRRARGHLASPTRHCRPGGEAPEAFGTGAQTSVWAGDADLRMTAR